MSAFVKFVAFAGLSAMANGMCSQFDEVYCLNGLKNTGNGNTVEDCCTDGGACIGECTSGCDPDFVCLAFYTGNPEDVDCEIDLQGVCRDDCSGNPCNNADGQLGRAYCRIQLNNQGAKCCKGGGCDPLN